MKEVPISDLEETFRIFDEVKIMIIDAHTHFNMGSESADPGLGQKKVLNAMRYGMGACVISNVVTDTSSGGGEFPSSEHLRRVNTYAADQVLAVSQNAPGMVT